MQAADEEKEEGLIQPAFETCIDLVFSPAVKPAFHLFGG
jgi:hypothetical protein